MIKHKTVLFLLLFVASIINAAEKAPLQQQSVAHKVLGGVKLYSAVVNVVSSLGMFVLCVDTFLSDQPDTEKPTAETMQHFETILKGYAVSAFAFMACNALQHLINQNLSIQQHTKEKKK